MFFPEALSLYPEVFPWQIAQLLSVVIFPVLRVYIDIDLIIKAQISVTT
jgi:hypothetical protein